MKLDDLVESINQKIKEEPIYTLGDVYEIIDSDVKRVAEDIDPDNHRWYQVATDVYECEDGFLGVRGVNIIFSESMCGEDCNEDIELFEVKQVKTITYERA